MTGRKARDEKQAEQPRDGGEAEVKHFTPRKAPPVDEKEWDDALRER